MARLQVSLLALANLLIPVAILVFATGFFPYKPFMPGLATYEDLGWEGKMAWTKEPDPKFDKLVFMVVDALRSDFVFSKESGMAFVQSLIRSGSAIPFTAHATSPTITMPRVKAITTGSIPSFLDVILNFAESDTTSTLATQDTWLAQLKAREGGKLVMYGDDTWLKLFPGFFERADGTSSFFVSDFTEVDNNVTRHVPDELLNSDWDAMIMHYLGLDHIGHKTGPKGPNMVPKQKEMDGIVRQIYEAIENEEHLLNTLFVLCGDHGMNDGGNHGGSTPGETSPALVFMSPKIKKITEAMERKSPIEPKANFEYYRIIEQSDIAPTLAGLMGYPVPKNNLGVFIEEFLDLWDDAADRVRLLLHNARQIKKIVEATFPNLSFSDEFVEDMHCEGSLNSGQELACKWQDIVRAMSSVASLHPQIRVEYIYNFCRTAQNVMSSTASNYNVSRLVLGTSLAFLSFAFTLASLYRRLRDVSASGIFYTLTLVLYCILMFASSYVEEEHNFWYWATSLWFFYLFISDSREQWFKNFIFHPAIMLLFLHRIARRWNQTGQKYAGADDIAHSIIFLGRNSIVLWSLVGATYMDIVLRLAQHVARSLATFISDQSVGEAESTEGHRFMATIAILPLGITAFVFKMAFTARDAPELVLGLNEELLAWLDSTALVEMARMVFGGIALTASWIASAEWKRAVNKKKGRGNGDFAIALFDLAILFLMTQTKAQNIPLYLLFRVQLFFLSKSRSLSTISIRDSNVQLVGYLNLTPLAITLTTLLLTQSAFFILGNSNAISSIDLSNSYNGVSGFNITVVGTLVFLSNWAGPVYWSLAGITLLGSHGKTQRYIDEGELDNRDWIKKEREHLDRLVRQEKREGEMRSGWAGWEEHVALLTLFVGASLVSVMTACTVLRQHLFVWSVFSPKFLYGMAWSVAWHFGITVGLGALWWWVGGW
ncbi:GPI ethanolamine phosphate transferas-like protein 2 [Lojkania enalia]|uniref:GPI ethanolamine phosphate transferase 2 n=1 Tax=Lojkania enalia TaxID=147567 RepID=A0A9P4N3R0_9PLEO|nr:GPI ethanolamine phosphate transferas-like protein 2 [Didymosphaeria enalia]